SFTLVLAAPAYARLNVYVANSGTDVGACSLGAPCKTFQYALNQVQAGGIVTALDSAGYSPFTITKSVTIMAPAGVSPLILTPPNGDAITIIIGPTDTVSLRGLTLDGGGVASDGIDFEGAGNLEIVDCVVRKFTDVGLGFVPQASASLKVVNSEFS